MRPETSCISTGTLPFPDQSEAVPLPFLTPLPQGDIRDNILVNPVGDPAMERLLLDYPQDIWESLEDCLKIPGFDLGVSLSVGDLILRSSWGDDFDFGDVPSEPVGSLKKVSDSWLKKNGVDPHTVKGELNYNSRQDIYKDAANNLWAKGKRAPDSSAEYLGNMSNF